MKTRNVRRKPIGKSQAGAVMPRNRHEKRAAEKRARKAGGKSKGQMTPEMETFMDQVTLQDRIHGVMQDYFKGKETTEESVEELIITLGATAAGIAASIGWGEFQFAEKMRKQMAMVLEALESAKATAPEDG